MFQTQDWLRGMLQLHKGALCLCESGVWQKQPPYAVLRRPILFNVYSDTISFSGIELEGRQWVAQVWYCEVGSR